MRDPYDVLGLPRTADADAIKGAYRKLAKQYHPDLNPGRKDIESRFKEISAAYDLLSDPKKKSRYDRGEIDAEGNERGFRGRGGGGFGGGFGGGRSSSGGPGGGSGGGFGGGFGGFNFDADDIFDIFSQGRDKQRGRGGEARRGPDVNYSLSVDFAAAALGTKRRLTMPDGRTLDVNIPPGTADGTKLRLKGQGQTPVGGGVPGDAFIEVHVEPHPFFTTKGQDIHLDVPITLQEAVLGASVTVPTIDGRVAVKVPKGSNTGSTLRLKGKGIANAKGDRGDQYVRLVVTLPEKIDDDLAGFIEKWAPKHPYEVRGKFNR